MSKSLEEELKDAGLIKQDTKHGFVKTEVYCKHKEIKSEEEVYLIAKKLGYDFRVKGNQYFFSKEIGE